MIAVVCNFFLVLNRWCCWLPLVHTCWLQHQTTHDTPVTQRSKAYQRALRILVVVGVGFILGDGVLTPSVSVLSAIEGIQIPAPSVSRGMLWDIMGLLMGRFLQ